VSAARSRPVPDQSGARSARQLVPCAVGLLPWSARSGLRLARAPGVAWRADRCTRSPSRSRCVGNTNPDTRVVLPGRHCEPPHAGHDADGGDIVE
jgi:hypothetical protein